MLQPTVRRTWAPKGQTPIHYSWNRHDRISAISAVSLSPKREHLGLYFQLVDHNIKGDDVEGFVAMLLDHFPKGLLVVWDRGPVHRGARPRLEKRFGRRLQFEWLPPYAPDLNPAEQVWNHSKTVDLANFIPAEVDDLEANVYQSLTQMRQQQSLLCSFFEHAKLCL